MGASDRHYFAWLRGALERFEAETEAFAALGRETDRPDLWVLAGARANPAVELVAERLGGARVAVTYLDRFERGPGVVAADMNALEALPADACDVLLMSRASYLIDDPRAFLAGARRILRPGGLAIVDWIHGGADAPRLDLPGGHEYEGRTYPFRTTYADAQALAAFPREFDALLAHVSRPPVWVDVDRPGGRVPAAERLRRLVRRRPRGTLERAGYLAALGEALGRAGKRLIDPGLMEEHFKVAFRDARYFYRLTGKFYLHLLTVLRPVGKAVAEDAA